MPRHKLHDPERFAVPSYTGGGTWLDRHGYVMEYAKGHPMANSQGWAPQHRLVASDQLGRPLLPTEHVHHQNGDHADNRPENLIVLDGHAHLSLHSSVPKLQLDETQVTQAILEHGSIAAAARSLGVCNQTLRKRFPNVARRVVAHPQPKRIRVNRSPTRLTDQEVSAALQGRTAAQAAVLLGLPPNGLHYKFGHLLNKRRGPGDAFPADFVAEVQRMALDPTIGTRAASQTLGVTPNTLRACCRQHEIAWIAAPVGRRKSSSPAPSKNDD